MNRRGNTTVIVALSSTTLLGIAALTIDLGYVRVVQAQLQNVADAAAHGGSNQFDGTDLGIANARAMAAHVAAMNPVAGEPITLSSADIVVGHWDPALRLFTPTSDPMYANTVRVNANIANLGLLFAPVAVGTTSMPVRARSAMKAAHGGAGSVDCYLPLALPSCLVELHTLEGMRRYVLRPPLAVDRIERLADGRVRVGMKRVWSDGTGAIELSALELCEKLAAIVPPARANQVLYAGVLAGNAAWRAEVVPKVPSSTEAEREARASLRLVKRAAKRGRVKVADDAPPGWAELLRRVFGVDGWACPDCGKRMRLRTVVVGSPASTTIVTGLLRSTGPPAPRRGGDDQGVHAGA